ncbi:MAG TPA: HupE/UreJ family protein, partial [Candidatus Eisenbacteria bacterium]|nr:HupE/UreJ family protein [Candidatus Eisenbacteria bacterium]
PRGIDGRVMAHVVDLAHDAGLPDPTALLDANVARARTAALHAVLERRLQLTADGARVRPRWTSRSALPDRKLLVFEFFSPGAAHALALQGPLFPYDPLHETFLNVYAGGTLRVQDLLDHRHTRVAWSDGTPRQSALAVARTFVLQGIRHIFIGPDHILFIVGLLLLGGGLARLLKIVTAFTLAHSITLALAALQLVHPSPRVIEPAIALSIVCVGIENLLAARRPRDVRALLAFAFGFVHGFGFAGVLQEFGLPRGSLGIALAAFNVGVEIGQACIVLAVVPIVALARRAGPMAARRLVWAGSGVVIAAGAFWFVQRVWFKA